MRRVLLVDDHSLFREALGTVLVWDGFDQDHHARSGPEGAERLARLDDSIDVAVVGLDLDEASGVGWIRRMRETEPDVPIVVLAASSEPGVHERLRGLGVEEVLTTDDPLGRIVDAIRRLAGA